MTFIPADNSLPSFNAPIEIWFNYYGPYLGWLLDHPIIFGVIVVSSIFLVLRAVR